jgi:hypothetical protein
MTIEQILSRSTGLQCLSNDALKVKITTGSKNLDELLGGGIESKASISLNTAIVLSISARKVPHRHCFRRASPKSRESTGAAKPSSRTRFASPRSFRANMVEPTVSVFPCFALGLSVFALLSRLSFRRRRESSLHRHRGHLPSEPNQGHLRALRSRRRRRPRKHHRRPCTQPRDANGAVLTAWPVARL